MSGSTDHVRKNRDHWESYSMDWIRLFLDSGLMVEDLIELRPPADATTTYPDYATLEWARAFPSEHIWKVRKASGAAS